MTIQELWNLTEKLEDKLEKYYLDKNENTRVLDGILSVDDFYNAKFKILWILKEAHGEGNFVYSEYIGDFHYQQKFYTSPNLWKRMMYVNYGIQNEKERKYNYMEDYDKDENVFNALKQGALINLKKIPGGTTSNYNDIAEYYQRDKELIQEQIRLINPDIIICGGTFDIIKHDFKLDNPTKIVNENGYEKDKKLFIKAYHPSSRMGEEKYVDSILETVEQWLKQKENA